MRQHVESILWLTVPISFILAAMISAKIPLILLGALGVGATVVVIPLHFFRAWRKFGSVPNKGEYALWVGLEMLFAVGLIGGFVFVILSR